MQDLYNPEIPEHMKHMLIGFGRVFTCIRFDDTSVEAIHQALLQIVSDTESMSIERIGEPDPDYTSEFEQRLKVWKITYGTKTIADTYMKNIQYYHLYNFNVRKVCETVVNRFPYSAHEIEPFDETVIPPPIQEIRRWTVVDANLCLHHQLNKRPTIMLEFTHPEGDRHTRYWIYTHIKSLIHKTILWNSRRAYLTFIEGAQYDNRDPVRRYLFNDMISRELCVFLPR